MQCPTTGSCAPSARWVGVGEGMTPDLNVPHGVLLAYGLQASGLRKLGGTSQNTFRHEDIILKKVGDEREATWISQAYRSLSSSDFRVPSPVLSSHGRYSEEGWFAYRHLEGVHLEKNWREKLAVCRKFNAVSSRLDWPEWTERRQDPWSRGHRVAWGREPIPSSWSSLAASTIRELLGQCRQDDAGCGSQVIHGDLAGNLIFSKAGLPPALIDFSPCFGPPQYSDAILFVDVFAWESATKSEFDFYEFTESFRSLLFRATAFRLSVVAEFDLRQGTSHFLKTHARWKTAIAGVI